MICQKCQREVSKDEQRVMENYHFKNCIFCRRDAQVDRLSSKYRQGFLDSYKLK